MTNKEKAEKKRVEKRLEKAKKIYFDAVYKSSFPIWDKERIRLRRRALILARRINRLNAKLACYD